MTGTRIGVTPVFPVHHARGGEFTPGKSGGTVGHGESGDSPARRSEHGAYRIALVGDWLFPDRAHISTSTSNWAERFVDIIFIAVGG
ncbi:hypothetical protein AB0M44_40760 [Streptosporangium subroseum]|uniref:hypothetical protein n=1 Tax=Streptosporangium subroseum TaxID=106412 RepID=UPI00341D941F